MQRKCIRKQEEYNTGSDAMYTENSLATPQTLASINVNRCPLGKINVHSRPHGRKRV